MQSVDILPRTMPKTTNRAETTLAGHSVTYEIRRSPEANEPRIDVDIEGVAIVLPADSSAEPETLLQENANWVLDKKGKYDRYRAQAPDRTFEPGETFPYLGEPHEVVVEQRSSSEVVDGSFRLARHHVEQTSIRRALETLYRRKAREIFSERADRFATGMEVEYGKIEIRNQRTKWGNCSTTGTLSLNWRLTMAPMEIVDYVVIHELSHLVVPDHDREFWELVRGHDPDYREHVQWLEKNSTSLIFDEDDL